MKKQTLLFDNNQATITQNYEGITKESDQNFSYNYIHKRI